MTTEVLPILRAVYLCEGVTRIDDAKLNLEGLLGSLHSAVFPYVHPALCVFVLMSGGLGSTTIHFDLVDDENRLVYSTRRQSISFSDRRRTFQLSYLIRDVPFNAPGLYSIELFCNNQFMGDAPLHLKLAED